MPGSRPHRCNRVIGFLVARLARHGCTRKRLFHHEATKPRRKRITSAKFGSFRRPVPAAYRDRQPGNALPDLHICWAMEGRCREPCPIGGLRSAASKQFLPQRQNEVHSCSVEGTKMVLTSNIVNAEVDQAPQFGRGLGPAYRDDNGPDDQRTTSQSVPSALAEQPNSLDAARYNPQEKISAPAPQSN